MDIGFDPREWSTASPDEAQRGSMHPDWHALRARLNAALEARRALTRGSLEGSARVFGSCSRRAAVSVERITGHCDPVNQTNLANRKPDECTIPVAADMSTTGRRG
jgi:hypothetical protein